MKITKCRSCNSKDLKSIISLGEHYVSTFINSEEEQNSKTKVPLNLILCDECKLLQLEHTAPDDEMWNSQYWYKSAINPIIRNDLKDIVENAERLIPLKDYDVVIDIGANDGTLLNYYQKKNLNFIGFEPCKNVATEAEEKGFKIINNFFNSEDFKEKKAKVITAISMFYDLDNPNKFLEDIKKCLDRNGLFIIQQNYLLSMLKQNAVCNLCHEHREFYSLQSLTTLLERHGLEIFDIEVNSINGGSIRTYIKLKENTTIVSPEGSLERIQKQREEEDGLDTLKPYKEFADRISTTKKNLLDFIEQEKKKGKRFCALGASTRGNTILQAFNLTPDLIECIFDKNPDKWGKKTIGSLIPIKSPEEVKKIKPDYQIVLIWSLFGGLDDNERDFLKEGGKFVLPLPKFRIVSDENS